MIRRRDTGAAENDELLPVGEKVGDAPARPPERCPLRGRFVTLAPLDADADAGELFRVSHESKEARRLWTYLLQGPFSSEEAMERWLRQIQESPDPLFFTIVDAERRQRLGMVSFLNIVPPMRRLEVGNIWYAPAAQRTSINTEALHLMLGYAFDELGYRRVEWKCDALNRRSREAALRLGFEFEGVFRQHMVVKGKNRDTAWYALLDRDWPGVKENLRRWLYEDSDPRGSLRRLNEGLRRPEGL